MNRLIAFTALGLPGHRDYRLRLDRPTSIIVGPNGTGKSTFLILLYLFLSKQWDRLSEYDFDTLILEHSTGRVTLEKSALLTSDTLTAPNNASERLITRLREQKALNLIYKPTLTKTEKAVFSNVTGLPSNQIDSFRNYMQRQFGFMGALQDIEGQIIDLNLGPILYLPTYRRIEKDIKSIFPDIETRLRAKFDEGMTSPRGDGSVFEIAGFGMADIKRLIDSYLSRSLDFRRVASEEASKEYISDIISGRIDSYSIAQLRQLDSDEFREFEKSLREGAFAEDERGRMLAKIEEARTRQTGKPKAELRYLGMFMERLLEAHRKVMQHERPLKMFMEKVSSYIRPDKTVDLRDQNISIRSNSDGATIELERLSSGEKQIISIFARLLLSDRNGFVVLIDEPELSLSVPWQKSFLPDVISTGNCANVISVTHSPFVFDNHLNSCVVDVRKLRIIDNG